MTRPPDHDDARGSAAVDDEAHIAAHELGHDAEAASTWSTSWQPPASG